VRNPEEVLIKEDLRMFLKNRYMNEGLTDSEVDNIIRELEKLPASDLYDSNKSVMKMVSDVFFKT